MLQAPVSHYRPPQHGSSLDYYKLLRELQRMSLLQQTFANGRRLLMPNQLTCQTTHSDLAIIASWGSRWFSSGGKPGNDSSSSRSPSEPQNSAPNASPSSAGSSNSANLGQQLREQASQGAHMLSQRVAHLQNLARRKFAEFTSPPVQEASSTSRSPIKGPDPGSLSRAGAGHSAEAGAGISGAITDKLTQLARLLNHTTGYSRIERLRESVTNADQELSRSRDYSKRMKQEYEAVLAEQLKLQRDLNSLLQRKSSWGDTDVQRFTELYRGEHKLDAQVAAARDAHEAAIEAVEGAQVALMQAIRERYTEEQMWAEKIRRAATWWTWILVVTQLLSFLGVVFVIEPRRVRTLMDKMDKLLTDHEATVSDQVKQQLATQTEAIDGLLTNSQVNVVMHALGGAGQGPSKSQGPSAGAVAAGDQQSPQQQADTSRMFEAVVMFMEGVQHELTAQRHMLQQLDARLQSGEQPVIVAAPVAEQPQPVQAGTGSKPASRLTPEQAAGIAAALAAAAGALVGVLLATVLQGGGGG